MKTTQRRPSPRALVLAVVLFVAVLAVEVSGLVRGDVPSVGTIDLRVILGALAMLLIGGAVLDLVLIHRLETPSLRRVLPRSLFLKAWSEIGVELRSAGSLDAGTLLVDGVPPTADIEGLPLSLSVASGDAGKLRGRYRIRPLVRGEAMLSPATLRAESPLRFWRYTARLGSEEIVRVYPNFAATARFDEIVQTARMQEVGIKRKRRRGEGLEFHQLREYRAGDTIRQIDWKATSRKRELISREYEAEHDQRVVFMLDCSRRMRMKDGELSHFDHALNAMILTAHVAQRSGDAVGMMSFGDSSRWMPPTRGAQAISRMLHRVYDLEPTALGVDFRGAAEELGRRQRRRSMVVLVTHLRSEDLADLLPAIRLLRKTHYVVVADLRQIEFDETLARDPEDFGETLTAMGVWQSSLDRDALHDRLRASGVHSIDCVPSALGTALVNRYLDVKHGGLL